MEHKYLNKDGLKRVFDVVWSRMASLENDVTQILNGIVNVMVREAPSDGTLYGRKDGDWEEIDVNNSVFINSLLDAETITAEVFKTIEDAVVSGKQIYSVASSSGERVLLDCVLFLQNDDGTQIGLYAPMLELCGIFCIILFVKSTKDGADSYEREILQTPRVLVEGDDPFTIKKTGDGTQFLSNDGSYKEIKSSGGDGAIPQELQNSILDAVNDITLNNQNVQGDGTITQAQYDALKNAVDATGVEAGNYFRIAYDVLSDNIKNNTNNLQAIATGYVCFESNSIYVFSDFTFGTFYPLAGNQTCVIGQFLEVKQDLSINYIHRINSFESTGDGKRFLSDNGTYVALPTMEDLASALVLKNVTTATSLSNLPITNYSIKVTLSAASALSFAYIPYEGWECMIDIKNTGSSAITQALPNATSWQCDATSINIAAGKIASISVRYIHETYVVLTKGD